MRFHFHFFQDKRPRPTPVSAPACFAVKDVAATQALASGAAPQLLGSQRSVPSGESFASSRTLECKASQCPAASWFRFTG